MDMFNFYMNFFVLLPSNVFFLPHIFSSYNEILLFTFLSIRPPQPVLFLF